MSSRREQLDPRVWLLWAVAAGLPPLLGRNPFVLIAVLLACLGVRGAVVSETAAAASWGWIIRLAALFAVIGAVFNLLTVHIGDQQIATLPGSVPIIGGPLTWNALAYGLLSGLAILILVIIGVTLAACLDHAELLRMLPGRLMTVAVAGSVALAFLPQTVTAFHEIREAQAARGYRLRGARGLVPLIVPLLTGGLERALTLAEALEARGFGAPVSLPNESSAPRNVLPPRGAKDPALNHISPLKGAENTTVGGASRLKPAYEGERGVFSPARIGSMNRWRIQILGAWRSIATALGLTGAAAGAYLLATGNAKIGLLILGLGGGGFVSAGWEPRRQRRRRTRYRQAAWSGRDTMVAVAALVTLAAEIIVLNVDPAAFQYQPYPAFTAPPINLWLLAAFALLLAPAAVAPPPVDPVVSDEAGRR